MPAYRFLIEGGIKLSVQNTHFGAESIKTMLRGVKNIFFIGIGGISMSALAELSAFEGYRVGGSDRAATALTSALEKKGINVYVGHDANNLNGYDAVVYTVAIGADNPEYCAARRRGLPLISRADYLGYLMSRFQNRIGIAGMHGKSTCTAMCASIFTACEGDATILCGAELPVLKNSTCRIGSSREHFVFEACEYMDSFLDFYPTLAVILNVGLDHVDYFHSMEQIRASFLAYARRTGKNGCVLYNADDGETLLALQQFEGKRVGFGLSQNTDFTATNIVASDGSTSFDFCLHGTVIGRLSLPITGRHNLYTALAAATAATLCGISIEVIAKGLAHFAGAHRRMERKGRLPSGAVVYDDYGHHPDEIKATLAGAREMGFSRVLCAYQPHTYSRTAGLLEEFINAFELSDHVFFADIYAAREQNVYGVSSQMLADRIGKNATYCGSFFSLAKAIQQQAREGDLVIVMGAGDVYKVFDLLELK